MNVVILTGNLVRDPEKSYTNSGMAVTRFTIAVNRNYSKKTEGGQDADFIRVTCFDKRAEFVEKYLTKGRKVGVEARVQTGSYEKDGKTVYTTDFIANNIEFLDSKKDADGGGSGFSGGSYGGQFRDRSEPALTEPPKPADTPAPPPDGFAELEDDDMPF